MRAQLRKMIKDYSANTEFDRGARVAILDVMNKLYPLDTPMFYLVNRVKSEIVFRDENKSRVEYVNTNRFAPGPDASNYSVMDDDEAWEYWQDVYYSSGVAYEGLGRCEDAQREMFNDWLEEGR